MAHLGPCWHVEFQLCRTDLRIHGEGSNVYKNAGAAFLDLHEFLGLEITQDDAHLLQWHFGIFGNKTQRVESGGLQQVDLIVPGQCLRISLPEGGDCGGYRWSAGQSLRGYSGGDNMF